MKPEFFVVLNKTIVNVAREYEADQLDIVKCLIASAACQLEDSPEDLQQFLLACAIIFRQAHSQKLEEEHITVHSLKKNKVDN